MEQKLKKFLNDNRWFIVFYLIWVFIHIILLMNGGDYSDFWPFGGIDDIPDYGTVEFFVYTGIPLLIFIISKLVGTEIKEAIDEQRKEE